MIPLLKYINSRFILLPGIYFNAEMPEGSTADLKELPCGKALETAIGVWGHGLADMIVKESVHANWGSSYLKPNISCSNMKHLWNYGSVFYKYVSLCLILSLVHVNLIANAS